MTPEQARLVQLAMAGFVLLVWGTGVMASVVRGVDLDLNFHAGCTAVLAAVLGASLFIPKSGGNGNGGTPK